MRPVKYKTMSMANFVYPSGESIYDLDWDLLIILDACRLDLMREMSNEYEWIKQIESIRSVNTATAAWMNDTFIDAYRDQIDNTAYICGNPFSDENINRDDFSELIEVWRFAWETPGTVPPEAITDETIRTMRESDHEHVIAHYMQPHCPFLSNPELSQGKELDKFGDQDWRDVWEKLGDGDLDRDEVWEAYGENLRYGLDEVESLLQNVDADQVVITSDHGNAIGEWTTYGHPPNLPLKCLRSVPWIETCATDHYTREIDEWQDESANVAIEEQLSALGYK